MSAAQHAPGDWYCPGCQSYVSMVSNAEACTLCGAPCQWHDASVPASVYDAAPDLLAVVECVDALRWRDEEHGRPDVMQARVLEVLHRHGYPSDGEPECDLRQMAWVDDLAAAALKKARGE